MSGAKLSFGARSRATVGLVMLLITPFLIAKSIGIAPDHRQTIMEGRARLCEAMAVTASLFVNRLEFSRIEAYLGIIVDRDDNVLSAAVRRADGRVMVEVGDHRVHWHLDGSLHPAETQIHVAIHERERMWGEVEVRFRAFQQPGWRGWLANPSTRTLVFVAGVSYVLCWLYIGRLFVPPDATRRVSRSSRSTQNSLADGLLITDKEGTVVMADDAFASWVGASREELTGIRVAQLPFRRQNGTQQGDFPWVRAILEESPQTNTLMKLGSENSGERALLANASPVLGHDGTCRGALTCFTDVTPLARAKGDRRTNVVTAEAGAK